METMVLKNNLFFENSQASSAAELVPQFVLDMLTGAAVSTGMIPGVSCLWFDLLVPNTVKPPNEPSFLQLNHPDHILV